MSTPIATLEERHARIELALAGVELTEDEERFVTWMAGWDDSTVDRLVSVLSKARTAALPEGWTTHTLRHRFATSAYAVERDLRAVQELLGHSKPESTARYAAVPEGAKRSAVAGVSLRW